MIRIQPASKDDEAFLFELYAQTRADEVRMWGFEQAAVHTFLSMQWAAQLRSYALQYPDAEHQVIFVESSRAGRCIIFRTEQHMTLVDITLLTEYRNQGIGTSLLKSLQDEAAFLSCPLRLSVLKGNSARRLYERLDFKTTGGTEMYDFMEWNA